MSKCLKCGAALPPVGDCPACATAASHPASGAVPNLLDKDIQIDRRRTPEATPAVPGPAVPSFAELARGPLTPPGRTPAQPPAMPQSQRIPPPVPAPSRASSSDPSADITLSDSSTATTLSDPSTAVTLPLGTPVSVATAAPAPAPHIPTAPPAPTAMAAPAQPVPVDVVTFSPQARIPVPPPPGSVPPEELTPRVPHPAVAPTEPAAKARSRTAATKDLPEVHEVHARPASLWRRLLSFTIDSAAIVGVAALYIFLASTIAGIQAPSSQGLTTLDSIAAWMQALKSVLLPGVILLLVLATAYCAVAAFLWNGRTLGRLVLGLRLVDTHGLAPAPTRAIVRALLSVVSFGLFLGGFWMALFDRRGQTLHDKLTSTFVVQPS